MGTVLYCATLFSFFYPLTPRLQSVDLHRQASRSTFARQANKGKKVGRRKGRKKREWWVLQVNIYVTANTRATTTTKNNSSRTSPLRILCTHSQYLTANQLSPLIAAVFRINQSIQSFTHSLYTARTASLTSALCSCTSYPLHNHLETPFFILWKDLQKQK